MSRERKARMREGSSESEDDCVRAQKSLPTVAALVAAERPRHHHPCSSAALPMAPPHLCSSVRRMALIVEASSWVPGDVCGEASSCSWPIVGEMEYTSRDKEGEEERGVKYTGGPQTYREQPLDDFVSRRGIMTWREPNSCGGNLAKWPFIYFRSSQHISLSPLESFGMGRGGAARWARQGGDRPCSSPLSNPQPSISESPSPSPITKSCCVAH
uniref:Uncharacterized protein n=1 Tax=Oryza punctata TaxID=4537 RepID=A0A0E0MJV0_ORYPU